MSKPTIVSRWIYCLPILLHALPLWAATNTVTSNADSGAGTLRSTILSSGAGDTIEFALPPGSTITLASTLTLTQNLTIDGSGSPGLTIDGNHAVTVFVVLSGVSATISNMTITHGAANSSASPCPGFCGGGIADLGSLRVTNVAVTGNSAGNWGGGIYDAGNGVLDIVNSTISGNVAGYGGGLFFIHGTGTVMMRLWNTTIAGNSSPTANGSGILMDSSYSLDVYSITNSTVTDEIAGSFGSVAVQNSIFSSCGPDQVLNDKGGNVDAGTSCLGIFEDPTSKVNAALDLGPLQDNGGPTQTMLPGPSSQAIDSGIDSVCAASMVNGIDQRGIGRPQGAHCDAGAVEVYKSCYVKFDAAGANDGSSWDDAYVDLQSALSGGSGCGRISVARGVYKPSTTNDPSQSFTVPPRTGVYGGYSGIGTERNPLLFRTVLSGDIDGNDSGSNGIDADTSQIVGNNTLHVVVMDGTTAAGPITASTLLDGFTITGGLANGGNNDDVGAGLLCNGSNSTCSPTLNQLVFSGNLANSSGGAIYNAGVGGTASPTLTNSTLSGNSAANGGAMFNNGVTGTSSPTIGNVTFANNSASQCGGAIYDLGITGVADPTITNATFSGNSAASNGGAICDLIPFGVSGQASPVLTNVVLWNNGVAIVDTPPATGTSGSTLNYVVTDSGCPDNAQSCSNLIAADPQLGALQDNGGATPTMMPGAGSSAINTGFDGACGSAPVSNVDQRGVTRLIGAHCDIGAVEATNLALSISDGSLFGFYGKASQYVVTLQNLSSTDTVPGVSVYGFGTAALDAANTSWFCTVGNCTTTTQYGPLADTATLVPSGTLTWLVSAPVLGDSTDAIATMSVHSNAVGSAQDTNTLAIFRGTFEAH